MSNRKLNVSEFAERRGVSRMTVLRRIRAGELPAEQRTLEEAHAGRPRRYEWLIDTNAKFTKYQAGRPPKPSEIEAVVAGKLGAVPRKRKPAALGGTDGRVVSIFDRRRR